MLHGRQIPVEETLDKVEAVTEEDVAELAREFFRSELISFGAIGDLNNTAITRDRLSVK